MTYQLYQQDCLEWMRQQPDDIIDCVIYSPPYNKKGLRGGRRTSTQLWRGANIDYGVYADNMPEDQYKRWQIAVMDECWRIIKPTGSIFYQHKIRNWDRKGSHPYEWLSQCRAQFYQEIVWYRKSTPALDERYLFATTERIYWFCKDKPNVYKQQLDRHYRSDIWTIFPDKGNSHPASFPVQLAKNCVLLATSVNDIVYDPFAGTGTTLAVAQEFGCVGIGTEIDPDYCQFIHHRLQCP